MKAQVKNTFCKKYIIAQKVKIGPRQKHLKQKRWTKSNLVGVEKEKNMKITKLRYLHRIKNQNISTLKD